jgi:hypothetical protein
LQALPVKEKNGMSTITLDALIQQAELLPLEEQLRLASYLMERAKTMHPRTSRRKWRDIRGLVRPSLLGEDAQAWVSRTRREADEHRKRQWEG